MGFRITQELDVLDDKCVVGSDSGRTLCSGCIKTDGFVVSDAVTESFYRLKFIIDISLTEALCF